MVVVVVVAWQGPDGSFLALTILRVGFVPAATRHMEGSMQLLPASSILAEAPV